MSETPQCLVTSSFADSDYSQAVTGTCRMLIEDAASVAQSSTFLKDSFLLSNRKNVINIGPVIVQGC